MKKVNSRSLWLALLLGAVFLTPTPSFAQTYVGVYGGGAFPHNVEMTVPSFGITIPDVEFEEGAIVGARVGYVMSMPKMVRHPAPLLGGFMGMFLCPSRYRSFAMWSRTKG